MKRGELTNVNNRGIKKAAKQFVRRLNQTYYRLNPVHTGDVPGFSLLVIVAGEHNTNTIHEH